ncbi:MAG: hypothetical protein ACOY3P_01090 [Planctomycetota bacterium]
MRFTGLPYRGKPKILLSEGSSTSSRQTLMALGPGYVIDVLDPGRLCQSRFSRYVRRFYKCPAAARDPLAYLRFVVRRLYDGDYDVLLPTHDQVYLFARFRDDLSQLAGLALPSFEAIRQMQEKAGFARLLEELDLPRPPTQILPSPDAWGDVRQFPCYVKLPHSTAGNGVRLVRNAKQLRAALDEFRAVGRLDDRTELVVQQPVSGVMRVMYAVFRNGELMGVHCTEATRIGLGSQAGRVGVLHPKAIEYTTRLGRHLGWHGAMFLDYLYDRETDSLRFLECNPRIGETVNARLSGVNLAQMLVRISMDEDVPVAPPPQPGVRTNTGFVQRLSLAVDERAGRGAIFCDAFCEFLRCGAYRDAENEMVRVREDYLSMLPPLFVTSQLLLSPRNAEKIVAGAVNRYSLPESATRTIDEMPDDTVRRLLDEVARSRSGR